MIRWPKQLFNWIGRIVRWLREEHRARISKLIGIVLLIAFCCLMFIPGWEQKIRITGMCLELLKLFTIVIGLKEIRKQFDLPSMLKAIAADLKSIPKFKVKPHVITGVGDIVEDNDFGLAYITTSLPADMPLADKVAELEKMIRQTDLRHHELRGQVEDIPRKLQSALESKSRKLEAADEENRKKLQNAVAGGVYLEWIGVFCFALGIVLATASNEIVSLFSRN